MKKEEIAKAKLYYITHDISATKLAKKFNISYDLIRRYSAKEGWVELRKQKLQEISEKATEKIVNKEVDRKVALNEKHIELYDKSALIAEWILEEFDKAQNAKKKKTTSVAFALEKILNCIDKIQKGQRLALNMEKEENNISDKPVINYIEGVNINKV